MLLAICALSTVLSGIASAQTAKGAAALPLTDSDIQLLRSDLQADKNQVVADTMKFTDAESAAFTPVYRNYVRDQQVIGDERVQLIKDYAQNYDTMDDTTAKSLAQRLFNIEDKTLKLQKDYWPKFVKALGAKRAAKFYQVDNRLTMLVNVQLTSGIPLIP
jgi:hypothetical protein